MVSYLKPMAGDGKILAEDDPVLEYYLPGVRWKNWQAINVNDDVSMFRGQILTGQYAAVESFLKNPEAWSKARTAARR